MVVRDQWLQRLNDFAGNDAAIADWTSRSLEQPALFTTTTYQGLYSFDKRLTKAEDRLQSWFEQQGIKLLILDEAHHLKAAWWQVLMKLVRGADDLIVVSLTATPPYDANTTEWSRYMQLCGPVDEEISVPELVRSNSLCPHQDYIWMVDTDASNITSLNRQKQRLSEFIEALTQNQELLYLLSLHTWLEPERTPSVNDILSKLNECFALLALLKQQDQPLPPALLTLLDKSPKDIPAMDVFDWEVLLQSFLSGVNYPNVPAVTTFRESLSALLRRKHFLKHQRVSLDNSANKLKTFNKTQERIKGCFDIASVEYASRQDRMRLVVLADYIRDEKFQLSLDGLEAPTGCYPIFHYFLFHLPKGLALKTVLLTGRLSIIHRHLLDKLSTVIPDDCAIQSTTYSEQPDYVVLDMPSQVLSSAFTTLHRNGDLQILIGTRGLLGEGWDAPHVNSLILATQTGAYVTTNQLRGRAIRIDTDDELKTASIWHIIAVAPDASNNALIFDDLNRRFKTFAGIHANELQIESGIERLVFANDEFSTQIGDFAQHSNQLMVSRLQSDIFNLQARWQNALEKVDKHVFQLGLQMHWGKSQQWQHLTYAFTRRKQGFFSQLLTPLGASASILGLVGTTGAAFSSDFAPMTSSVFGLGGMGIAMLLSQLGINAKWQSHFDQLPENNSRRSGVKLSASGQADNETMRKFAQVVLNALRDTGQIKTSNLAKTQSDEISVTELKSGYFRFSLNGFTRQENDTFLTGLSQLLEPIRQPRYILTLTKNPEVHQIIPVPHILGNNKKNATAFFAQWTQHFSDTQPTAALHWTASEMGQRHLLKARVAAYGEQAASGKDPAISLIDRWE